MDTDAKRRSVPAGPQLLTSRLLRRFRIATLSVRSILRAGVTRMRLVFTSHDRKDELVSVAQLRTAQDVARELGNMKGAIMKLGQMASFVATNLSSDIRAHLATLQQAAPPMSWDLVQQQIEAELGQPPDKIFERIEKTPAAAASIGQVHRALLEDGTPVAVKIQYPGVDKAIETDLENAWVLKLLISRAFPGVDPNSIFEEFRARLTEELDYRNEATNHRVLEQAWRGDPCVVIPRVFEELTTKRVLVTQWYEGKKFDDVLAAAQNEKDRIGAEIYRFSQECVGRIHFFSGDPHPGNYIFLDDGRIVFLDFGCMKRLNNETLRAQKRIVEAARRNDTEAMLESMKEAGYVSTDTTDNQAETIAHFLKTLIAPIVEDKPYRFTPASRAEVARFFTTEDDKAESVRKLWSLPKDLVYFNRLNLGIAGILTALQARANWHRIYEAAWADV